MDDREALEALVRAVKKRSSDHQTPPSSEPPDDVWTAAARGDVAGTLRFVRGEGCSPDAREGSGWTPLMFAAYAGHKAVARALLECGAEPEAGVAGLCPLHCAAQNGHLAVCEQLLAAGAAPSPCAPPGWTPLHYAASRGHTEVVRFLVRSGAASCVTPADVGDADADDDDDDDDVSTVACDLVSCASGGTWHRL